MVGHSMISNLSGQEKDFFKLRKAEKDLQRDAIHSCPKAEAEARLAAARSRPRRSVKMVAYS